MQILPSNSTDSTFGYFSSANENSAADFMSAMQDALNAVDNGDAFSVNSALEDDSLVESPYSRHTTDGVTYTLDEVCFTKNELLELRQQLLKEGAPVESLKQFDILADQPDGATLAQVMASLSGKSSNINITDQDAHEITALLGQIDPSGTLASDALALMRQGQGMEALDLIQGALNKLGLDHGISVDADSIAALGRGLGLNADSLNGLVANFEKISGLTINGQQFDALMAPAKNQFVTEAANAEKLEAALEKTLKPIISKARARMEKEKEANALSSRRVEQSKILIDRTVQKNSRQTIDETVTGEHMQKTGRPDAVANKINGQENGKMGELDNADNMLEGLALQNDVLPDSGLLAHLTKAGEQKNNSDLFRENKDSKDSRGDLTSKIIIKPSALNAEAAIFAMQHSEFIANAEQARLSGQAQINYANLNDQVQNGLLMALKDGSMRLDLQLHPAELGAIDISLVTSRSGELTAQIKADRPETVDALNQQIDTIRANLEQQGIKIEKIEVTLENKENQNAFDDMGQHNARQEENARRQELNRMRNLAAVINGGENTSLSGLERSLHNIGQSARYAGHKLYVVA